MHAAPIQRYPIRRAILGGLGGIVAAGLLMLVASSAFQIQSTSANNAASWRAYQLLDSIGGLQTAEESTRGTVLVALADPTPDHLAAVEDAQRALDASQQSLVEQVAADPAMTSDLQAAAKSISHWYDTWANPSRDAVAAGVSLSTRPDLALVHGDELFAIARGDVAALKAVANTRTAAGLSQLEQQGIVTAIAVGILAVGLCLGILFVGRWLIRVVTGPLKRLNETAFAQLNGEDVTFIPERDDEVGALAVVLERLRLMVDERYSGAQAEARLAATVNKLSDLIAFSSEEFEVIDGTVRALRRLVTTPRGDVQLTNASRNRLLYAGSWGPQPPGLDTLVPVDRIDRCPAIRRGSPFVVPDVDDDLAVLCAAHPQESGSLACIPLIAMGQPIGVIHLESETPINEESVSIAMRLAEQVAVAVANARLITTMESLAMTDGLTGLRNPRFFDTYLEQELAATERDHEPLSVLMIDIDHFKKFNDTYGHPAGDEALRAFGRVVRTSLRSSDLAARYGGEEFVVALRHTDLDGAAIVAEKLREAVSQVVVDIGPGRFGRLTVSIGVAQADPGRLDPKSLVAAADSALYRAKSIGRNRVCRSDDPQVVAGPLDEGGGPAAIRTAPKPTVLTAHRRRRTQGGGAVSADGRAVAKPIVVEARPA